MSQDELGRLRALAQQAMNETLDIPGYVATLIKAAAREDIAPWVLIGVLIEGTAHLVRTTIPEQRRSECIKAALQLLRDRLAL